MLKANYKGNYKLEKQKNQLGLYCHNAAKRGGQLEPEWQSGSGQNLTIKASL